MRAPSSLADQTIPGIRSGLRRCAHTATYSDAKLDEIVANYRQHSHHQVILAMREIEHRRSS